MPLTSKPKAGKIVQPNTKMSHQKLENNVSTTTPANATGISTASAVVTCARGLMLFTSSPKNSSGSPRLLRRDSGL